MAAFVRISLTGFLALLLCANGATAQKHDDVSKEKGPEYLQNGEWAKAVKAFEMVTAEQPNNIGAWFQMGFALHSLKEYDRAIDAYSTVLKAGATPIAPLTKYNLGCAYALKGEPETAIEWLEKAADAGFSQIMQMKSDGDLAGLREHERFPGIMEKVDRNARPCVYNEKARELDFWVGNWDVYNKAGQYAGSNRVERELAECVIHENWTSPGDGLNGQSFSTYDPVIDKWRQTWVDNQGATYQFVGEIVDGAMVFNRESEDAEGNVILTRMTLAPLEDGKIHQFGQNSTDDGRTWTTNFDLIYMRKGDDGSGS